ncbi:MAG: hypothetical protein HQK66_08810 [Desulfamplus sp.]|nr:hypothetical protein [Desulfamplus sp.]
MITRQLIKKEIDTIPENYIEVLYKIIKALQISNRSDTIKKKSNTDWLQFINETYGCLAYDPIERGKQGEYEIREEFK